MIQRGKKVAGQLSAADHNAQTAFRGSFSGYERNRFFARLDGSAGFTELGYPLGLDFEHDGRATATIDVDGDGDLDLALLSLQDLRLLLNTGGPTNHFSRVRLETDVGPAGAIGARVIMRTGEHRQIRQLGLTAGFQTRVSSTLHFGLGQAKAIDSVEVQWPSGGTSRFESLAVDRLLVLRQGATQAEVKEISRWPASLAPRPVGAYSLQAPVTLLGAGTRPLGKQGRPTIVNFWAPWCEACIRELPVLNDLPEVEDGRVSLIPVSVERSPAEQLRESAAKLGVKGPLRVATDELLQSFFGTKSKIPLPATFIFDASGSLHRSYFEEISAAGLSAVLRAMQTPAAAEDLLLLAQEGDSTRSPAQQLALAQQAVKLGGARGRPLQALARAYLESGEPNKAIATIRSALEADASQPMIWMTLGRILEQNGNLNGAADAFLKAIELDPHIEAAYKALPGLLTKLGRYKELRAAMRQGSVLLAPGRAPGSGPPGGPGPPGAGP